MNKGDCVVIDNDEFNPKFCPMPNSCSRFDAFIEVCETVRAKIIKRDPKKVNWDTIHDAYPLKDLIIE